MLVPSASSFSDWGTELTISSSGFGRVWSVAPRADDWEAWPGTELTIPSSGFIADAAGAVLAAGAVPAAGAGSEAGVADAAAGTAGEGLAGVGAGCASGLAVMLESGGGCDTPEYGSEFPACCPNAAPETASVAARAA